MKKRLHGLMRLAAMVLVAGLLHGCPGAPGGLFVAWLVNATDTITFTHFIYDEVNNQDVLVELDAPIAPGEAARFRFNAAFRDAANRVGLDGFGPNNTGLSFSFVNNGEFGYGGTDVLVSYKSGTFSDVKWTKEPS
jgi:hypothetical protein